MWFTKCKIKNKNEALNKLASLIGLNHLHNYIEKMRHFLQIDYTQYSIFNKHTLRVVAKHYIFADMREGEGNSGSTPLLRFFVRFHPVLEFIFTPPHNTPDHPPPLTAHSGRPPLSSLSLSSPKSTETTETNTEQHSFSVFIHTALANCN